ncbi:putative NAD-dependent epimerase/dehydratase, NAD(P)-binding domain superfamily [Helianthus annuus]|nr:putative NAD-dependent epimerase/dehydratase, NAD(P)-binding domain superfamily [Helianthus annuus]
MESVCVTGAGGYVASWVVQELLAKGYIVHGTVRDPDDEKKNGHLKTLEHAKERLRLFKADLLDYAGLCIAIHGCTGVIHVATPVPAGKVTNPQAEMLEPAITGTRNVMNACLKSKVNKVVVVSSVLAVVVNPIWPKDQTIDENCWSDAEFCMKTEKWYCASKAISEREALEFGKKNNLNVVSICPSVVFGPMLQSTLCTTNIILLNLFKGKNSLNLIEFDKAEEDRDVPIVDVRDCAKALLLAYEKPEAEGRYLCSAHVLRTNALIELLKKLFPRYSYPTNLHVSTEDLNYTCEKLMNLGWNYRPLEKTLVDSVEKMKEAGFLS